MKDHVKELWKMIGICLLTLGWDIAYIATMVVTIRDTKNLMWMFLFIAVFTVLTVIWNIAVVDSTIQAVKEYKNKKKEEENEALQ